MIADRSKYFVGTIGETVFREDLRLNTYAAKWDSEDDEYLKTPFIHNNDDIGGALYETLVCLARDAWRATGVRGYARIDMRLNAEETPCVLDVNPNCALNPAFGVCRAAQQVGWSWEKFVKQQLKWAV